MFFIYLRRELRRRMRQVIFIALGLALGIGLVITVTAASSGVKNAQGSVLHSLYGVDTDITVTQPRPARGPAAFGFSGRTGTGTAGPARRSRRQPDQRGWAPWASSSVTRRKSEATSPRWRAV